MPRSEPSYTGDRYASDPYAALRPADPYTAAPRPEGPEDPYAGDPYASRTEDPYTATSRFERPYAEDPRTATAGPPGGGRRRRRKAARAGQSHSPLIIGGAIVAGTALMATGMGISSLLRDDSSTTSANSPQVTPSTTPTGTPSKRPVFGNSRKTDPVPLTLAEIFRHRTFTVGSVRYTMTVWRADRVCARTVNGATLAAALRRGSCTQVMRATFASADGKLIGTVGVANLSTSTAAKATTRLWNTKDAWLRPLPGPGATKKIGTGSALGSFQNKGHYLLMTWVQRPNGKAIPATQQKLVSTFGQSVMLGSGLYEALNYRGTEGKPLQS